MTHLPFSDACERNKGPILEVLRQVLPERGRVLEIGSCTGQHVVHFARALRDLTWQPSDQCEYLGGLAERIRLEGLPNIMEPLELDVTKTWPVARFEAVYSSNTAHIMGWDAVGFMFAGTGSVLRSRGLFCLYGPFNEDGAFTSASNEEFDRSLRIRDHAMGIRDRAALESLAKDHQMELERQFRLPANNSLLVFRKFGEQPDV